jgi:hypothetical protein
VNFRARDFIPRESRPDTLVRLTRPAELRGQSVWALGFYAEDSNGRMREQATRLLAENTHGEELPFLLLRLNDWVLPIRRLTCDAVAGRFTLENVDRWIALARLVEQVLQGKRDDHTWLQKAYLALLRRPDCRQALWHGTTSEDACVVRTCWHQLLATSPLDDPLWEKALDRPEVARSVAQNLAEKLPPEALAALTSRRLHRRPYSLAALLLARLAERAPDLAGSLLRDALLSPGTTLRRYARFYLERDEPDLDFAAFYRDALPSLGGFLGLGEIGSAADAVLLGPWLETQPAALEALARLDFDAALPRLLDALGSEHGNWRRVARKALLTRPLDAQSRAESLAFDTSLSPEIRRGAFSVLTALPHYRRIAFLVRGCDDPFLQGRAQDCLRSWRRRNAHVFVRPSPLECDALRQALGRSSQAGAVWRDLEQLLKWADAQSG